MDQESRRPYLGADTPPLENDPLVSPLDAIRDNVASRSLRMDAAFPEALDLEAEILEEMHKALFGVTRLTAGTVTREAWHAMLLGRRPMVISHLCRLVTEPGREGHDAVAAVVAVLAARLGILTSVRS